MNLVRSGSEAANRERIAEMWLKGEDGAGDINLMGTTSPDIRKGIGHYLKTGEVRGPKIGPYHGSIRAKDPTTHLITRDRQDKRFIGLGADFELKVGERRAIDDMYLEAAKRLSEATGSEWTGEEVQASIWRTIKYRLYLQEKLQDHARALRTRGIPYPELARLHEAGDAAGVKALLEAKTAGMSAEKRADTYRRWDAIVTETEKKKTDYVPPDYDPGMLEGLAGSFRRAGVSSADFRQGGTFYDEGSALSLAQLVRILDLSVKGPLPKRRRGRPRKEESVPVRRRGRKSS